MPSSWVDVCNQALLKIGSKTINDLSENTKAAKLCNLAYQDCRNYVLRRHPWKVATTRVELAPDLVPPAFDYDQAFTMPADNLRLLAVKNVTDYQKEGDKILCNESSLQIKYIRRIDEASELDELLADAISCRIAFQISFALTELKETKESAWKEWVLAMKTARFVDSTENPSPEFQDDTWLAVRDTGSSTVPDASV